MAAVTLNLATQCCPDLENIIFYLGPPQFSDNSTQVSNLHILMGAPISDTWLRAQNLRSLVTDTSALDASSLLALGELPYLDSLEVRGLAKLYYNGGSPKHLPASVQTMNLSRNSFPSLRRLALYETHRNDILLLWKLKPMVKRLNRVEVTIELAPDRRAKDEIVENELFLTPFLPMMCAGSPQLTELVINNQPEVPKEAPELGSGNFAIDHFRCLGSLPLQHIKFIGIPIVNPNKDSPFPKHAATLWPMAVDLDLPDQKIHPDELHYFAMIPNLHRLVLCLWDDCIYDGPKPTPQDHPLRTLEIKHGLQGELKDVPMDEFARYLLFNLGV